MMNEGRDLRNKVCFIDDFAFAVGGLNSKAEKFNYKEKKWCPVLCTGFLRILLESLNLL